VGHLVTENHVCDQGGFPRTIELGIKGTHVLNGAFFSLPYDPLNDFAPVALLSTASMILFGRKNIPVEDLNELIVWLRTNPNTVSVGFGGGDSRLLTAFFQKVIGAQFALVPYRGSAPAMQDLVAQQIDILFGTVDQLSLARAGSIKAYAVTSDTRLAAAPDIPTFREMGLPALSYSTWVGLFAPKGTPKDIIDKLNTTVVEALADAAVRSRAADLLPEIVPRERQTPEALGALQKADADKWWPIIKELGIRAQ
jgi:tripartite-type tricarboxylate transporter receptor subunit TctC